METTPTIIRKYKVTGLRSSVTTEAAKPVEVKPVEESKHAYRFKTIAELEAEFGKDFRTNKKLIWNSSVESFAGKEFDRSIKYNVLPFKVSNGMGLYAGYYVVADLLTVANQKLVDAYMREPKYIVKVEPSGDVSSVLVNNVSVCMIDHAPTGNCQVASFIDFAGIAHVTSKPADVGEILRLISDHVDKKLYVIDIKQYLVKDYGWDKLPGLVMLNPYHSTNGSDMYLGLINLKG